MKKYEVELTILFTKKLDVLAEDRESAAEYAEELFFRTNALSFDKDNVLDITTRVQTADTGYMSKYLDELDEDDGCSDYDMDDFMDEDCELPFDSYQADDEDEDEDEDYDEDADEEYTDRLIHLLLQAFDNSKESLRHVVEIADKLKKITGENIYLTLLS